MKASRRTATQHVSIHWYRVLGCVLVAAPWVILTLITL